MKLLHEFRNVPFGPGGKPVQLILLAVLLLLSPIWAYGQARTVSGKLTDENGSPLPGVNIIVKGTTTGTLSDIDGNYRLEVEEGAILVYTYIGYEGQEIALGAQSVVDLAMTVEVSQLEELVVTGYSVERKKDLLGAVSVVDMEMQKDVTYPNVLARLQGRIPGVTVNLNPAPGQGANVLIRGRSTLGTNDPLYIVDGVPISPFATFDQGQEVKLHDLSWLNPSDVESIQVLKDASAATIYGSRANNGVVIITTKQAVAQKTEVTVRATFGVENWGPNAYDEVLTSEGRATILWQKAVNDGADPNIIGMPYQYQWHLDPGLGVGFQGTGVPVLDQIIYPDWLDQTAQQLRPAGHPQSVWTGTEFGAPNIETGTDWWEQITQTGIVQDYDVSLSTGGNRGGARFSMNYFNHKGVGIGSDYNRISIRLNSHYKFANDKVTVGQNIAFVNSESLWIPETTQGGGSLIVRGIRQNSIMPVFTEDGKLTGTPGAGFSLRTNPLADVEDNKDDRIHEVKVLGNVYLDWQIIEGLSFRTNLGADYDNIFSRDILRSYQRGAIGIPVPELTEIQTHRTNWVWNNTLTYSKTINDHTFTVLAGTEAIENFITRFGANGKEFALETNDYFQLDAASGSRTSFGNSQGFSLYSFFGKVNYSFQDKYLVSATVRRDGSSRFGSENRYAVFPAASVGWRIVNEDFMSGLSWLSDLKLRVAYGQTGNQNIEDNARFGLYEALYADQSIMLPWDVAFFGTVPNATSYDIGNNNTGLLPSGFLATQTENQDLKWETQTEINIGLDFGFIDDRLVGSFEFYNKETDDILIQKVAIDALGDGSARFVNGATMETNGWEAFLEYRQLTGDWQYTISTNLSHFQDKITVLPEGLFSSFPGNQEQNILGHSPDAFFAYTTDGIFQNQGEVDGHATQAGAKVGALRFKDLNGDGVIDALDQEFHGTNGLAKVQYGINGQVSYRDFDLTLFFWGMAGRKKNDAYVPRREYADVQLIEENFGALNLDAWNFTNTDTHIPAQTLDATNFRSSGLNRQEPGSSYTWRNGNYFTLRQVTLGYAIPWSVVSALRVYISGENLFYITGGKGQDKWTAPGWQVENDGRHALTNRFAIYPKVPRYTLGLNVTF